MGNTHDKTRLVPTHPSNKNVLEQSLLWGWRIRVSTGDWVELEHSERAERIRVRAATHRAGNGHDVLARLYKLTCRGDATQFWTRVEPYHARPGKPAPANAGMTDEQMEEYAARMRQQRPQESLIDKLDRAAGLRIVPDPPEEPPMPEPTAPRDNTRSGRSTYRAGVRPRERTMEAEVLDVLERANLRRLDLDVLKALMPHLERGQLSNAMSRLADRGFVEQLSPRGNYRYSPPTPEPAPPIAAAPVQAPVEAPAPASPAPTSYDATVDAVMDLMFPDGAHMKHMAALIKWREDTIRLMVEVLDG